MSLCNYSARSSASAGYWKYFTVRIDCVYAFGYNSAENEPIWMESKTLSEYIVGGWFLQILSAIRAVAKAGERGEFLLFLSGKQRTISTISRRPNFTQFALKTWIGEAVNPFGTEF